MTTLIDQHMIAGTYSTTWNAQDVASGVYWYRLSAGGFSDTKMVVVLK